MPVPRCQSVRFFFTAILCVWVSASGLLRAQGLSDMRGTVVDSSGGALPGVSIVITNQATGTFREATSNADGSWSVPGLSPGAYGVTATDQMNRFLRRDLAVIVGTTATVPVTLELGALEETVTVTTEAPLVDVTSKRIGGNIDNKDLTQLPSISRNWLGFRAVAWCHPGAESHVVEIREYLGQWHGLAQRFLADRRGVGQRRLPWQNKAA